MREITVEEFIAIGDQLRYQCAEDLGTPAINLGPFIEAFPHKVEFEIPEELRGAELNVILPEIRGREYTWERDGQVIHRKMRYFQIRRSSIVEGNLMIIRIK